MPHKISYLLRNLLFGLVFFALLYFGIYQIMVKGKHPQGAYNFLIIIIADTICYPFAKAVYDEIARFLMGDSVYVVNIIVSVIIRYFIFMLSIFISPFYLLFFVPSVVNYLKKRANHGFFIYNRDFYRD